MFKLRKSILLPILGAGLLLLAGLGAAAIPGAVTGDAPAVVEQAITVTASPTTLVTSGSSFAGTKSADGTSFLAPVTASTGDSYTIKLTLGNKSKVTAAALMTVTLLAGFTLTGVTVAASHTAAQTGPTNWLLTIPAGTSASDNVQLSVRTDDTLTPGFYTISATIKQIEG